MAYRKGVTRGELDAAKTTCRKAYYSAVAWIAELARARVRADELRNVDELNDWLHEEIHASAWIEPQHSRLVLAISDNADAFADLYADDLRPTPGLGVSQVPWWTFAACAMRADVEDRIAADGKLFPSAE